MTPEQIAKESESSHQRALFCWCALNVGIYPELEWYHAIPNGGSRGDDAKTRAIRGSQLKAEGVKNGVSDTLLPVRRIFEGKVRSGLYIEMKKPKGKTPAGKESEAQKAFGKFVQSQGFVYACCDHWEKARDCLIFYLKLKKVVDEDVVKS